MFGAFMLLGLGVTFLDLSYFFLTLNHHNSMSMYSQLQQSCRKANGRKQMCATSCPMLRVVLSINLAQQYSQHVVETQLQPWHRCQTFSWCSVVNTQRTLCTIVGQNVKNALFANLALWLFLYYQILCKSLMAASLFNPQR